MKRFACKSWCCFFFAAVGLFALKSSGSGERLSSGESKIATGGAQAKYLALPLGGIAGKEADHKVVDRYGVPFIEGDLDLSRRGQARVTIGSR